MTREEIFKAAEERYIIRATACRTEKLVMQRLKQRFIETKLKELDEKSSTPTIKQPG